MIIYIVSLILSMAICYASTKVSNKKIKILLQVLSALPFFIIAAIRYDVGTDYLSRYTIDFENIRNGGMPYNQEIGFALFEKLCALISDDIIFLFIATSAIIIFAIYFLIYKNSKNPMLSIFIFFAGGFFFQSLNIVREYIAIAILILSYKYLLEDRYWIFFIFASLAFTIHVTSIVFIIGVFMKKKNYLNLRVIILLGLFFIVFNPILNKALMYIINITRFSAYKDLAFNRSEIRYLSLIMNLIIYLLLYYLYKKKQSEINEDDRFYLNMQGIAILCVLMGAVFYPLFRLAYYFSILQIISIPYFLYNYKEKNEMLQIKIIKKMKIKKSLIIKLGLIVLFIANISYTNVLHNDEEVIPYKTVFQKNDLNNLEER